jgi:hypothetical protein
VDAGSAFSVLLERGAPQTPRKNFYRGRHLQEGAVYKRKLKCMRNAEGYVYRKIPNNES